MAKRMILMLLALGAVIAGLGFFKFQQIQQAIAQGAAFQPPPEAVTTIVAKEDRWPETLHAIGSTTAVQGVTVSADLPGIVNEIAFESGQEVRAGDVLVVLDSRQEQAQLTAAEADADLAKVNFERLAGLVNTRAISRADYDRAEAEVKRTDARLGEIRTTMDRKTIRAPFTGVLGLREINLGQYLSPGDAVVSLQSLNPIYVNFAVPQQTAAQVGVGRTVRFTANNDAGGTAYTGRVTAINSVVDEETRNIQIQATLENPRGALRPGMFLEAEVMLGQSQTIVALPASAISYAPYGDSVFVVTELTAPTGQKYKGVRQQFVKLGASRGDQVAVLTGLNPGEEVVTSGVFKLRNGAAVFVNNEVQPSNEQAPKPEDS